MERQDHFILEGKTAIPVRLMEWAMWLEEHREDRIVAHTKTGEIGVSTVFIGLNHNYTNGEPHIFETMIFGGEHDGYTDRYSTWEQAEQGHKKACELILI